MTFNENALWRDEMNLRLSKLPSTKVLLKLEFDTEDQVLSQLVSLSVAILAELGTAQSQLVFISNFS